jgi:hypothetical protein
MLQWISIKWDGVIDLIYLAQDRDRWRAFVSAAINLQIP